MIFQIIHFSDIHFSHENNSILDKQEQLFNAIKNEMAEESLIFVSGDSAFSGTSEEFSIATDFYSNLSQRLNKYSERKFSIMVIPGNHDCNDLNADDPVRQSLLEAIQKSNTKPAIELIDMVSKSLLNYSTFEEGFNKELNCLLKTNLLKVYEYDFKGKKILFYCYNTAFQSIIHEVPGKMVYPLDLINQDIFKNQADLRISSFHHPFHWLNPENNRQFKNHVFHTSDFFVTGHEHVDSKSMISDLEDNVIYHIEGSVLQDSESKNNSGFKILNFDFANNKFQIKTLTWTGDRYIGNENSDTWIPLQRSVGILRDPYVHSEDFKLKLNDIGANFSHPNVAKVSLSDIYIHPNLEQINQPEESGNDVAVLTLNSLTVMSGLKEDIRIMFSGAENIGKTSLVKIYCKELHKQNMIPIITEGHQIKNTSPEDLTNLFRKQFLDQYCSNEEADFNELDKNKLVIMIDDFNRSKLNLKYKAKLLQNLINNFPNIIITGNEFMSLEDIITDEAIKEDLYSSFKIFEIKEFGYQLRSSLINKWNVLGVEHSMSDEERIRKLQESETVINTVIGVNFVPSYPFFILTILQSIELGNPTDLSASTYGHYYQFLIQKSFAHILKSQREITEYENYLSELSFHLFDNSLEEFDIHGFEDFDKKYRKRYTISHSLDRIKDCLLNSNILENTGGVFGYKYSYIHYYFVSSYLANHISDASTKATITSLTDKLYKSEFSNILMFLTHHTKDNFLLTELLKKAKSIFKDFAPCKLENDIKTINSLVEKMPDLVFESLSVDQYREEENILKDRSSQGENSDVEKSTNIGEDENEINIVSNLNTAFKSIEIIGQILKNNYGKIENSSIEDLIEESVLLGLRTLNVFFSIIESNSEFVINQVNSIITEIEKARGKKLDNPKKIEQLSKNTLFGLCSQISYSFIKKISDSIGTEYLNDILEKVYKNQDFNSVKLLKLAIKLDHYRSFPDSDLKKLKTELDGLHLPNQIMKRLVINHLYLYPTDHTKKDRILSLLSIPMKTQVRIDQTSKQKKRINS